jgi:hypothetical protein
MYTVYIRSGEESIFLQFYQLLSCGTLEDGKRWNDGMEPLERNGII